MKYLVLDVETTTKNKGNPFTQDNKLCIVSYATAEETGYVKVEYDDEPYAEALAFIQRLVDSADILVGFNLKFDLHWLRRYGIKFDGKRVWDCQLVSFMLDYQRNAYPSLDGCSKGIGLVGKGDNHVSLCWHHGIDTPDIPLRYLVPYALGDADDTKSLYLWQVNAVYDKPAKFRALVNLHNADIIVTQEMEYNGLDYDVAESLKKAAEIGEEVKQLDRELADAFGADWINWDSPKQLSAVLYGGTVTKDWREQVDVYKSGQKIGQPRYKVMREEHEFRRLVEPPKGSELENGGWSTSEDVFRCLKPKNKTVTHALGLLLHRSKLEKLRGTYYEGLPELISRMGWADGRIHGTLNHTVARTGRLSSSKPNLQNITAEVDKLFRSRFEGGQVVAADAKGLEWVCIAYQSQDLVAMQEIKAGVDQHEMNKERFGLPDKRVAKYFVFRLIYGGMARTFTKDPDFSWVSTSEPYWDDVMGKFYTKYAGIDKVHKQWYNNAIENGKFITPSGREFIFTSEGGDWKWVRPVILNYPVQSFGADLMAIARVSLYRRMKAAGVKSVLVNTVHDSIVIDIHPDEWYTISTMVKNVFDDIPKNFEKLFGEVFNLPMKAECKRLNGEEINV